MIVGFFADSAADRKATSRAKYERQCQKEENERHRQDVRPADIQREIQFLTDINERQDLKDQVQDFTLATKGFLTFWVGWSFGTVMYFFYVFFLTVAYGNVVPTTPAGRVVSIIFSLLAVPIISGFAVQAITEVVTRISIWRLNERKASTGIDNNTFKAIGNAPPISHADLRNSKTADTNDEEKRLLREALNQAVELEAHARRLSINHLPNGSKAQFILKADRKVQVRDVQAIHERYCSQPQAANKSQLHVNKAKAEGGRTQDAFGGLDDVSKPLGEEERVDEI
ncbi:hypothetical protein FRB96_009703 [Tulasnella sp. 330]|nr:hypothetical protein FRB96_009703 [Tulasnella sp. 330]